MKHLKVLFISIILFAFSGSSSFAAEKNESFPFIITPVLTKNQDPSVKGYFQLNVGKNEVQNLQIKIRNITNKDQMVKIIPTNALTSLNGEIEYVEHKGNKNSFLNDEKFALSKYISIAPMISIKANETKTIPLVVDTPNEEVGTYLGGVLFIPEGQFDDYELKGDKGIAFEIQNQIAFAMAVQLDFPKKDKGNVKIKKSGMKFLPTGIQVYTQISNEAAKIEKSITGNYVIRNKKGEKLFSGKIETINMAPKSSMRYPVFWNSDKIAAEDYIFDLNLNVDGKKISSSNSFKVDEDDLREYQSGFDLPTHNSNKLNFKIIGIGIVLVLLTLIAGVLYSQREKK